MNVDTINIGLIIISLTLAGGVVVAHLKGFDKPSGKGFWYNF